MRDFCFCPCRKIFFIFPLTKRPPYASYFMKGPKKQGSEVFVYMDDAEKEQKQTKKRPALSDAEIVALYRKRYESAISETETKYGRLLYSVAYSILGSREDAEECVNDTYVRAWESVAFDDPDNLSAYLCRITRNLAIDMYRRGRSRAETATDAMEELADVVGSVDSDTMTDRVALTNAINRFFMSLPPKKRMIFMRRYFYMNSTKEIAKMLTTTDGAVRVTLHGLRKKLREYLEGEGIVYDPKKGK